LKEIELTPHFEGDPGIETVYFGGGTPSLLDRGELGEIIESIQKKFNIAQNAEVTLEANPDDIHHYILKDWLGLGVNRLSLGVQSFYDVDLEWMNRAHNSDQAKKSIQLIKDAGFSNFSADLIYGMPTLSDDHWRRNVDAMIEFDVPHLSCYALTVEPRTALSKMILTKQVRDVDPEQQAEQFLMLIKWLREAGYEHYEISNFAMPGMRSRHNSSYWRGKWYYGFGPSAHSFSGAERKWNVTNNALYQQSLLQNIIPTETEEISATQQLNEYVMVSLRTSAGIDLGHVEEKFGREEKTRIQQTGIKYIGAAKLVEEEGFLKLTDEGKLFADGIAADLFKVQSS
jgi:oxygen-independent coproporphyrinogen-3 oxidase